MVGLSECIASEVPSLLSILQLFATLLIFEPFCILFAMLIIKRESLAMRGVHFCLIAQVVPMRSLSISIVSLVEYPKEP